MSIWYQYDITAMGNRRAIGKFFNLDPEKDIHYIDNFQFSFGQKNVCGLRLGKLIEQNPDLVFLVRQVTDYDVTYWIERFIPAESKVQMIFISRDIHSEYSGTTYNTKLLKEYAERYPYLMDKISKGERQYEWRSFFVGVENPHQHAIDMLNRADEYKEMTDMGMEADPEFDNAPIEE